MCLIPKIKERVLAGKHKKPKFAFLDFFCGSKS
jgi:hypothetical protein